MRSAQDERLLCVTADAAHAGLGFLKMLTKPQPLLRVGRRACLDPTSASRPNAIAAAGALALLLLSSGCQTHHAAAQSTPIAAAAPSAPVAPPAFDADRAYAFLVAQCDMGTRVPNTPPHEVCKQYIIKEITPYVDKVDTQDFVFNDPDRHKRLLLTNIIGVINPTAPRKVLLFTHWDTRPTADQDLEPSNKFKPIPGADDGASGTAVLIELARTFHATRPKVGVVLLFVDGEDWGSYPSLSDDHMYLGARHFAADPGPYRPNYAILLDMIGDKNLQVHRERTSEDVHPEINDKVWSAAADLGYTDAFPNDVKYQMGDDHDTFNDHGIPAIDLIDFDYPYWHTLQDTPDKCSPHALQVVGQVVARVVYLEQ
jgi:glutaminyl-peptide cyclotransferase